MSTRRAPNVLNNASPLVSETNCLDLARQRRRARPTHRPRRAAEGRDERAAGPRATRRDARNRASRRTARPTSMAIRPPRQRPARKGPCDYAFKIAQQAEGARLRDLHHRLRRGRELHARERGQPVAQQVGDELLRQMATDDAHFYNQPKTQDLDPVFQAIGAAARRRLQARRVIDHPAIPGRRSIKGTGLFTSGAILSPTAGGAPWPTTRT